MDVHRRTRNFARRLRREMTLPEVLLWRELRPSACEAFRFRRQHPLGPYVLDFHCHAAGLAVEVDGDSHGAAGRAEHDARRTAWLASRGVRVLRLSARDVLEDVEGAVLTVLAEARPPQSASLTAPPRGSI